MVKLVNFAVILSLIVLSNATDDFVVELNPRIVDEVIGHNVTLGCSYNRPFTIIPMWEIDGMEYRVTELPLGYEADGTNITFRAVNSTTIRCFFYVFDGGFYVAHSNYVNVTTTPSPDFVGFPLEGNECNPVNITLLVLNNEIYISWDINRTNIMDCSFLVTVWNCSQTDTPPLKCVHHASDKSVRRLSLEECLGRHYSYPNGSVIDIKWNNSDCIEQDNSCSTDFYIPELTDSETVIIPRGLDVLFADLSNSYCNTNLEDPACLMLCFQSEGFDKCFLPHTLEGNEHFYLSDSANDTWLGVRGVNSSLNGTVISIFCIPEIPRNCLQPPKYIDINIFNFIIIVNGSVICEECSLNATCEAGQCVCNRGYAGNGTTCYESSVSPSLMATPTQTKSVVTKTQSTLTSSSMQYTPSPTKPTDVPYDPTGLIIGIMIALSVPVILYLLLGVVLVCAYVFQLCRKALATKEESCRSI